MADDPQPAVSVAFAVTIGDSHDLGSFTSCEGLGFEVVVEQREEGGNNRFVHQLPGRMKYTNIKLSRPINPDSRKVATWFASMHGQIKRTTMTVAAKRPDGETVASWSFQGVIPVKWTGPSLSVETNKMATESLELAHHGLV